MARIIPPSELVLNEQGLPYHIGIGKEQLSENIILVGDQGRVKSVGKYLSNIDHENHNREFFSITGSYNGKRVSVLSTGIGTDNIDIVVNELDAAFNIDLQSRTERKEHISLNLLRLGTSGSLQPELDVDSFVASSYAIGLDNVLHYYQQDVEDVGLTEAVRSQMGEAFDFIRAYGIAGSKTLLNKVASTETKGITLTASGFYGPQGRELRLKTRFQGLNEKLAATRYNGLQVTNYEMETSALYALGSMLGHDCATICLIIANRFKGAFSRNYQQRMKDLIEQSLHRLTSE